MSRLEIRAGLLEALIEHGSVGARRAFGSAERRRSATPTKVLHFVLVSMDQCADEPLRELFSCDVMVGAWPNGRHHTTVVIASKGLKRLFASTDVRVADLGDISKRKDLCFEVVNYADICPAFDALWHSEACVAAGSSGRALYVKELSVSSFSGPASMPYAKKVATQETYVCELLSRAGSRHENIAQYLGCIVRDGCVAALVFPKYYETLAERLERGCEPADFAAVVRGLRSAIAHLHNKGLSHNDINPHNVMFSGRQDTTPILIDFDSCRELDEPLIKRCTPGWGDLDATTARQEHDDKAVELIEAHLEKYTMNIKAQVGPL